MSDEKNTSVMELIGAYDSYVSAEELSADAVSEAPATTLPCASASSVPCFNVTYTVVIHC